MNTGMDCYLRTADGNSYTSFLGVVKNGGLGSFIANKTYGIATAFHILE